MRSADRCKEHWQGDRCRKEVGHHFIVALKGTDPVHTGNFTAWVGEGDSKEAKAATPGARPRHHRNRRMNRFHRIFTDKKENINLVGTKDRPVRKVMLEAIFKFFNGE